MRPSLAPKGRGCGRWLLAAALALLAPAVAAHGFGRLYTLPVPFWLYAWGAASTLLLSFLLVGLLAGRGAPAAPGRNAEQAGARPAERPLRPCGPRARGLLRLAQGLALGALLLAIATALFGNRDPYRNFSMVAFWVVFALGLPYLSALLGNVYARLNPWRTLAIVLAAPTGRLGRWGWAYLRGRWRWPAGLAEWPALALYLGFVWYELFAAGRPGSLGRLLLAYTLLNLAAVGAFGLRAWFARGEFFGLLLRLYGLLAPLAIRGPQEPGARLALRRPLQGLVDARAGSAALLLFALAMLSTTAFDGLRATQTWVALYWADPFGAVEAVLGSRPMAQPGPARSLYLLWESAWLLASPLLYALPYLACVAAAKALTRSQRPLRALALDFGLTLLPIALAYHAAHYATLLLADGMKILSLLSDPFGRGWDLFGTAWQFRQPILPPVAWVWHGQVGLILAGHVASVYVAHRVALRVFGSRGAALRSQLPMLAYMVLLTIVGLWILSQPLTAERMM